MFSAGNPSSVRLYMSLCNVLDRIVSDFERIA
jgi:hypothetical protein